MRYPLFSLILAVSVLLPMQASADNEDFGKSAVAQTLMKQARQQESAPVRTIAAPSAATPYEYREEIPEDVDGLMARVEAQHGALVEEFERFLSWDFVLIPTR